MAAFNFNIMKEIKLTHGFVAMVDDEDYEFVNQTKWSVSKSGNNFYAKGWRMVNGKMRSVRLHQLIIGVFDGSKIDHIDHDGLNCQKSNMRKCTHQQNMANRKPCGKSGYLGVSLEGRYFRSQITHNRTTIHMGTYRSEIEAALVYDEKAKELHGEFANLNFK